MKIDVAQSVIGLCLAGIILVSGMLVADESSSRESRPLEFRALMTTPGGALFSLHDASKGVTFWIELGQVRHGIEAVEFDSETNALRVNLEGALQTLHLSPSKVSSQAEPSPKLREGVYSLKDLSIDELEDKIKADERRYQLEAFVGRWRTAAAESAVLRDFESEIVRLTREGSKLLADRQQYWKDSHEHRALTGNGMDIGREMTRILREIEAALVENPTFREEDIDLFRSRSGFGMKTGSNIVNLSVQAGRYSVEVFWFEDRQSEE